MRQVADQDLAGRFEFEVDPEAAPVDTDAAVAKFLLAFVRSQAARSAGKPVEVDPPERRTA
jgi:hypothetical protein